MLKNKFFDLFQILHHVIGNHTYKLELPTNYKIQNIFYILILNQNIIKNSQVKKVNKIKQK